MVKDVSRVITGVMRISASLKYLYHLYVFLCTVWLGNGVVVMEFLGGLQTKENITDGHISDSDLVVFSHAADFH